TADGEFTVQLTRVDTGDVIDASQPVRLASWQDSTVLLYQPDQVLEPNTEYRADVDPGILEYPLNRVSATFTTGAGPTPTVSAPILRDARTRPGRHDAREFDCLGGGSFDSRTVDATVQLPSGLPAGSYVALGSHDPGSGFEEFDLAGTDPTFGFHLEQIV